MSRRQSSCPEGSDLRAHRGAFVDSCSREVLEARRWPGCSHHQQMQSLGVGEGESHSVVSDSLRPMDYTGQNTGVGSLSLFQGSSQPRDQTQVSCITGEYLTS